MHVLLADDNDVKQRLFKKMFERIGCSYAVVSNGREALDYLASPQVCPPPDLILLDISMPVMGGIEAANIIRSQPPFANNPKLRLTPLVALHAHRMRGDGEHFRKRGFDDALHWPFKMVRLTQLLLQYSRHQPVPVAPGAPMMAMQPIWGPFPMRKYRGPRSRL